jgi:hypothetical protein
VGANPSYIDGIVFLDLDRRSKLAEVLDEIESKRVVVIDHQDSKRHRAGDRSMRGAGHTVNRPWAPPRPATGAASQ